MARWNVGTQVAARENTALTGARMSDPEAPTVEAGTYGIVEAVHETVTGANERFAKNVTVRFGSLRIVCGTDELNHLGGSLGFVTPVMEARAQYQYATWRAAAALRWLARVEAEATDGR